MKRAALLLVLLTDELVQALDTAAPAAATDITHIACQPVAGDQAEVACRWRQRDGRNWLDWQSHLARSDTGWHMLDSPTRRP